MAGISVARALRRNRKITNTTRPMDSIRVNCTSSTEARIVSVRSTTTAIATAAGMARCKPGSAALIAATVETMLAPGCRWMSSTTAGLPLNQPATRSFSTPPITVPTSDSRTGERFL